MAADNTLSVLILPVMNTSAQVVVGAFRCTNGTKYQFCCFEPLLYWLLHPEVCYIHVFMFLLGEGFFLRFNIVGNFNHVFTKTEAYETYTSLMPPETVVKLFNPASTEFYRLRRAIRRR